MPFIQRQKAKPSQGGTSLAMTTMAKGGLDLKDLAEFMDPGHALKIENYFVLNNRGLSKRKGLTKMLEIAGNKPITLFETWKGYDIFAYDKTLAAYNPATDTVTTIKNDWATNAAFSGAPYGDYFFVGNTGNKINYITEAVGVFTATEIAAAPMSGVIRANGPRLYAAVGNDILYCQVDDGTNPPFTNWTISSTATAGGKVSFRNGGTVRAIAFLGDITIGFGDTGKFAFKITTQNDGSGTIVKLEDVVIDRVDMGGASGAITTPKGTFYVNEAGLWQLISLGQPNIPYSDQEHLTTINLGTEYFDNVNTDNLDIAYYARFSTILVTCAKASVQNNHVIAYQPDMKAFSTFNNWNINRWMTTDNDVFGGSSVKTALYHCFNGNSDDGVNISTNYLQELKTSHMRGRTGIPTPLWIRQMLYGAYIKGMLHSESVIHVALDIYNVKGELEINKKQFDWTTQYNLNELDGWGTAEWGSSSWGGDSDVSGLIESFSGMHSFIRNFQRIRIHITESSKLPHQIDYFVLDARPKVAIRNRKLAQINVPLN